MGRALILDTGVVIALERRRIDRTAVIGPDDSVGLAMISVAELRAGIALARPDYQPRMTAFVDGLLRVAEVVPYDDDVVAHHARLLAWTRQNGVPRGVADLMIAATAAATGRILVTLDARAQFADLPGVTAILVGVPEKTVE